MDYESEQVRDDVNSLEKRVIALESALNTLMDTLYDFGELNQEANSAILKLQLKFNS